MFADRLQTIQKQMFSEKWDEDRRKERRKRKKERVSEGGKEGKWMGGRVRETDSTIPDIKVINRWLKTTTFYY